MLDEMSQRSASKLTLILACENPGMFFFSIREFIGKIKLFMGLRTPKIMANFEAFCFGHFVKLKHVKFEE